MSATFLQQALPLLIPEGQISLVRLLLSAVVVVEICFFLVFRYYLVPRANRRTAPQAYRDYGTQRNQLLLRILNRICETCKRTGRSPVEGGEEFLRDWFEPAKTVPAGGAQKDKSMCSSPPPPSRLSSSVSSISSSSDNSSSSDDEEEEDLCKPNGSNRIVQGIHQQDMDEFLAWAFFEKDPADLVDWEMAQLQESYRHIQERLGLVFAPGRSSTFIPRRLSLEDVDPLQRPLLIYVLFGVLRWLASQILRMVGFERVVSQAGLVGWYRPARNATAEQYLPLLFFHGIAPGGLFFYLPMVLCGLAADGRATFLFENPNISSSIGFQALRETETVEGVLEICDRFLASHRPVSVCGHSFGSCPLTWLLKSPTFAPRIQQFVLLDPVTLLLSEPSVMVNFLYNKEMSKIRMAAGSELFTEYYLRRHFSWYNSELWLDDIPPNVRVLVGLAEKDELVDAPRVQRHVELFGSASSSSRQQQQQQLLYWNKVGHACCVTSPKKWRQIKLAMLQQELAIVKEQQQQQ